MSPAHHRRRHGSDAAVTPDPQLRALPPPLAARGEDAAVRARAGPRAAVPAQAVGRRGDRPGGAHAGPAPPVRALRHDPRRRRRRLGARRDRPPGAPARPRASRRRPRAPPPRRRRGQGGRRRGGEGEGARRGEGGREPGGGAAGQGTRGVRSPAAGRGGEAGARVPDGDAREGHQGGRRR